MHTHTILMSKRRKNEGGSGESTIIAAADFEASKNCIPFYILIETHSFYFCVHSCVAWVLFLVSHIALHFHLAIALVR